MKKKKMENKIKHSFETRKKNSIETRVKPVENIR